MRNLLIATAVLLVAAPAAGAAGQARNVGAIQVGRYGDSRADVAAFERPVAVITGGIPVKLD